MSFMRDGINNGLGILTGNTRRPDTCALAQSTIPSGHCICSVVPLPVEDVGVSIFEDSHIKRHSSLTVPHSSPISDRRFFRKRISGSQQRLFVRPSLKISDSALKLEPHKPHPETEGQNSFLQISSGIMASLPDRQLYQNTIPTSKVGLRKLNQSVSLITNHRSHKRQPSAPPVLIGYSAFMDSCKPRSFIDIGSVAPDPLDSVVAKRVFEELRTNDFPVYTHSPRLPPHLVSSTAKSTCNGIRGLDRIEWLKKASLISNYSSSTQNADSSQQTSKVAACDASSYHTHSADEKAGFDTVFSLGDDLNSRNALMLKHILHTTKHNSVCHLAISSPSNIVSSCVDDGDLENFINPASQQTANFPFASANISGACPTIQPQPFLSPTCTSIPTRPSAFPGQTQAIGFSFAPEKECPDHVEHSEENGLACRKTEQIVCRLKVVRIHGQLRRLTKDSRFSSDTLLTAIPFYASRVLFTFDSDPCFDSDKLKHDSITTAFDLDQHTAGWIMFECGLEKLTLTCVHRSGFEDNLDDFESPRRKRRNCEAVR
ncbi:unnamed protein product, partial [Protopolystoma xenopodis]